MENLTGDIIILHRFNLNDYHMIYGSSDMERDRHNFLSFRTFFLSFYAPNNSKNQNVGKLEKAPGDIIILNKCTIDDNHMVYGF